MPDTDLVVLGGGPAGLLAAAQAARRGLQVVCLERDPVLGGAARSIDVAGVPVDLGSHRLHRTIAVPVLTHLQDLLGSDLQDRPRHGRIRLDGRWLPFPLSPAALRRLPPAFAVRAAWDATTSWGRRPRSDTFAERIRAGLGPTMLDRFYGPYAEKLWGLSPTSIDGEQARVRVQASSAGQLARRVIRGRDPEARTFRYPRRGFGQIVDALAADAAAAGVDVRTDSAITSVAVSDDQVRVGAGRDVVTAHSVWSTIPLPVFARLVTDHPAVVADAAARLRSRALVLVYVVVDRPQLTPFDAHYLPERWTPISRLSEPKNYRDGHPSAADPGDPDDRTVLCAEIPCDVGDPMWSASDQDLVALVTSLLTVAGFPDAPVSGVHVERLPAAYPIYDLGYRRRLHVVDGWLRTRPQLVTFGRQGLFVHDNTHHTLAMAWAAAACADDRGRPDPAAWSSAREEFATHVVED